VGAAFVALFLLAAEPGVQTGGGGEPTVVESLTPGLVSGHLGAEASFQSQTRAGESPLVPGAAPELFVSETLIPRLALFLRNPDLTLSVWYAPRIFTEDPTPPGTSGTLVLHTFGLTLHDVPTRTVVVTGNVTGAVGQPDYSTLSVVLGTNQAALPRVTIIKLANAAASGRADARLTRRWDLTLALQAFYWHLIDYDAATLPPNTVTGQANGSVELGALYRLTPLNQLGLSTTVGDAVYSSYGGMVTVTPAAIWKAQLTPREDLRVTVGMTYARAVGTAAPGTVPLLGGESSAVSPIGSIDLGAHLARRDGVLFSGHLRGGVDYFLDPVLGTASPRVFSGLEFDTLSVSGWATGLRGDFSTSLRTTPYPLAPGQLPPDETAFSVILFVRRPVTHYLLAELSGQWANRGPALFTPDFHFHQRQLWVNLSITGTTRPIPRSGLPLD
jgi:hypothetical protein